MPDHSLHIVLPVLLAALAAFLIGALWYSPLLFANAWVRAQGFTPERLAAMQATAWRAYVGSGVAFLVMGSVLRLFLAHSRADSAGDGAAWAFHAWLGFALPIGVMSYLYTDKPLALLLIDTGYQLVYLTVMGAILGAWL